MRECSLTCITTSQQRLKPDVHAPLTFWYFDDELHCIKPVSIKLFKGRMVKCLEN